MNAKEITVFRNSCQPNIFTVNNKWMNRWSSKIRENSWFNQGEDPIKSENRKLQAKVHLEVSREVDCWNLSTIVGPSSVVKDVEGIWLPKAEVDYHPKMAMFTNIRLCVSFQFSEYAAYRRVGESGARMRPCKSSQKSRSPTMRKSRIQIKFDELSVVEQE